jgi:hypothetical protein
MISDKIRPHHLERKAILYVRQSSAHQVLHNRESSALQICHARVLGRLARRDVVPGDLVVIVVIGPSQDRIAGTGAWDGGGRASRPSLHDCEWQRRR